MRRAAGILLSVTSLPSRYGIGCFSKAAYDFVDWLKQAGQSYWQILPLGPTGYGDSPYQSFSTFAGNPWLISLEDLIEKGLLSKEECDAADFGREESRVDYEKIYRSRYGLLRKAWQRSRTVHSRDYRLFVKENGGWLKDYCLFMALKDFFGGAPWTEWPEEIRLRREDVLCSRRDNLEPEMSFHAYLQFVFYRQWMALKRYANTRGIRIIGDIPIYVAPDSADTWSHPELFMMEEDRGLSAVAGCPPDGFSASGQLWGNPLYRWPYHRETGYRWWFLRLAHCFRMYDVVRIDHFRGFDTYYSIPRGAETAACGHWEKGPGIDFFRRLRQELGPREVIAEDLGYMTDSVRRLVRESGYPGMKVLEFAFDSRDTGCASEYLPHNYPENTVAYTGTHDNETLTGWLQSITEEEKKAVRDYLCDHYTPDEKLYRPLIGLLMRSRAALCIIPMQDYLGLSNDCRMNRPSTVGNNWQWRITKDRLTKELAEDILEQTVRFGRKI